jgi:hypothetical protein
MSNPELSEFLDPATTSKPSSALKFLRKCYAGPEDGPAPVRVIRVLGCSINMRKSRVRARVRCVDGTVRIAEATIDLIGGETVWDPRDTRFTYQYATTNP